MPVTLDGLAVQPGDLLHGDVNGVLVVPADIAGRVAEQAERVRAAERLVLDFVKSPGLTVEKLRAFQEQFKHLRRGPHGVQTVAPMYRSVEVASL